MKYSAKTIRTLIRLRDGETVNQGEVSSEQLKELVRELSQRRALVSSRKGKSLIRYTASSQSQFMEACTQIDSALSNLEAALSLAEGGISSRAEKVVLFGNSKQEGADRTVRGFTLLSNKDLDVSYCGKVFTISPLAGLHVVNRNSLEIPADLVIIIVENTECFYDLRWIPQVGLDESKPYLILNRFPVSEEAKLWLESIPNPCLHFGDFDLGGIKIYETEFKRRLGDRISFVLPEDIEKRIRYNGNPSLYSEQMKTLSSVSSPSGELTGLLALLHKLQSCYEQEGYCLPFKV